MLCPNCDTELKIVKVNSQSKGFVLEIEQCSKCGGLWFDKYELYQIPSNEAKKINYLDIKSINSRHKIKKDLKCPKDKSNLEILKDSHLPKNVAISFCHKCNGIWLNKGDLHNFKKKIESKKQSTDFKPLVEATLGPSRSSTVLAGISESLMKQVNPSSMTVLEHNAYESPKALTNHEADLLRSLPKEKRLEMFRHMATSKKEETSRDAYFMHVFRGILAILRVFLLK